MRFTAMKLMIDGVRCCSTSFWRKTVIAAKQKMQSRSTTSVTRRQVMKHYFRASRGARFLSLFGEIFQDNKTKPNRHQNIQTTVLTLKPSSQRENCFHLRYFALLLYIRYLCSARRLLYLLCLCSMTFPSSSS